MLKLLKNLQLRDWIMIVISAALIVVQVWLDLRLPEYMQNITMILQFPLEHSLSDIWREGGYMLACALGSGALAVVVALFASLVAGNFSRNLRERLFNRVQDFSMEEINKFSTSSLITRSTNDVTQVQMIVAMGLQVMIKAPIMATWAIIKISGKSWQWSVATAVSVMIIFTVIVLLIVIVLPKFNKIQKLTDNLNMVTRENLTGIRVVHAYNAENYEQQKFRKANDELTDTNLFVNKSMGVMMPMMNLVMSGLGLAIYWIGAYIINSAGLMERGVLFADMMTFYMYAMQVVMSFMMLTMIFIMLPRATVSARRINEVLSTTPTISSGTTRESSSGVKGEIELRNVGFKYPDASDNVLTDINLKIEKGQTVAFIGSTGSGKSTLINLIPRFYDVTSGEILIDGVDVRDYDIKALHNKFGYVPQKAVLFSGTVRSNIAYGDSLVAPTDEGIAKALEIAQGSDFVSKMDGGVDTAIAQGGTNISGGQKQRVAIARAIARNPEILIFDDSFSALDYKTDRTLRSALKRETHDITTLIVAQRIGTILDADKIVVLDSGNIVGVGTHSELLKSCDVYLDIAQSQLSQEEINNAE